MTRKQAAERPVFYMGRVTVRAVRGPDDRGRFYWRTFRYAKGREVTKAIGWLTEADAEIEAAAIVAKMRPSMAAEDVVTVADLVAVWQGEQEDRADLSPRTLHGWRYHCAHLRDCIGEVRLDQVDVSTLERHRNTRIREGAAASTVRHELETLQLAWRWGQQIGACPARRLPKVTVHGPRKVTDRTPTLAEAVAVLQHMDRWPRVHAQLLFATGARVREVASLTWDRLDLNAGIVRFDGKTGPREVPLERSVVRMLRAWRKEVPGERVLPVTEDSAVNRLERTYLPRACVAAKVQRFTPHGLRRLAVDTYARNGVDVMTASALLGHSPQVMLAKYRQVTAEDKRKAVDSVRLGVVPAGEVVAFTGKRRK